MITACLSRPASAAALFGPMSRIMSSAATPRTRHSLPCAAELGPRPPHPPATAPRSHAMIFFASSTRPASARDLPDQKALRQAKRVRCRADDQRSTFFDSAASRGQLEDPLRAGDDLRHQQGAPDWRASCQGHRVSRRPSAGRRRRTQRISPRHASSLPRGAQGAERVVDVDVAADAATFLESISSSAFSPGLKQHSRAARLSHGFCRDPQSSLKAA